MTARDRIILVVVLAAVALGGFWFLALSPKRKEAADLRTQIDTATQQLAEAQQQATQARAAKARYDTDYADIAELGKAVPKNDAVPSLIYQLQAAAKGARIDFKSLKLAGGGGSAAPAPSTPAKDGTNAPATQAVSATLPPGASVGSAGFPTMPFTFVFNGSFFDMERFFRDVQRFVRVDGQAVDVRGRLLSVDAWSLAAGPKGFPSVTANVTATAYLQADGDTTAPTPAPATNAPTAEVAR